MLVAATLCAFVAPPAHAQFGQQQGSDLATVSLLSERDALVPGETNWIAVHFAIEPMWHLYWKNPGDSGQAPYLKWTAPEGVTIGEPLWPVPHRHVVGGGILDYTFDHELALLVPVTVDTTPTSGGSITISVKADYLVCKDVCLFGDGASTLTLPVAKNASPSKQAAVFARTRERLPRDAGLSGELGLTTDWSGDTLRITVPGAQSIAYFPERGDALAEPAGLVEEGETQGDTLEIRFADPSSAEAVAAVLTVTKAGATIHQSIRIPTPGEN